jgi:diguanylate cyclase (GGDEF)-like protein
LGSHRVDTLAEQAALHEARGDLGAALATYKAFHAAESELISEQREAQARTRQALFETAEARQEAARFREQARRDPLTGSWNRRFADESMPELLADAVTGATILVALIDIDHFKRVNDRLSHEVGDKVLVAVAGLIDAAVPASPPAGGFSARLGGEEFLLVITGMSLARAVYQVEDLRRTIERHRWRTLTGDLPVTVSIGVTAVEPGITQAELLARADASLYEAKRTGRNRVCVDPDTTLAERRRHRDNRPQPDEPTDR